MKFTELVAEIDALRLASNWIGIVNIITFENVTTALNCAQKAAPEDPQPLNDIEATVDEYLTLVIDVENAVDTSATLEFFIPGNILLNQVGREYRLARVNSVEYLTSVGHPDPEGKTTELLEIYIQNINEAQNVEIESPCS